VRSRPLVEPVLVLAAVAATGVLQLTGSGGPVRVAATLLFLALAPGLPFTPALPGEHVARASVAIALSFSIDALVVTALLAAGVYHPGLAFAVLAALAVIGSAVALARDAARRETFIRLNAP
jgi:hypothetical protein